MSYKALYRKYRPTSFEQVIGQEHVVQTLQNILRSCKIGHAYLFSGPKGSGKTSIANIFANVLNCTHSEDLAQACANCVSQIGQSIDIIEMDAASNNGVDDIRFLKEKIEQVPIYGRYKIYIIDEVHMLTKSAFNAFLKTLEEPPKHALFIFATTDPQKIPLTILSRLQRFNFTLLSNELIIQHLSNILKLEGIEYDYNSLRLIARLANGGMRDALSISDQCAALGQAKINLNVIESNFGIASNEQVINLVNELFNKDIQQVLKLVYKFKNAGIDAYQFALSFLNLVKEWLVYQKTLNKDFLQWLDLEEVNQLMINSDFAIQVLEEFNALLGNILRSDNGWELIEMSILKISNFEFNHQLEKNEQVKEKNSTGEKLEVMPENEVPEENPLHSFGIFEKVKQEWRPISSQLNENINNNSSLFEKELANETKTNHFIEQEILDDINDFDNSEISVNLDEETKVFDIEIQKEQQKSIKKEHSTQELVNLLHIVQKNIQPNTTRFFIKLRDSEAESDNFANTEWVNILSKIKILLSSNTWLLCTSDDENIIKELEKIKDDQDFQEYIKKVFNNYLHIYIVNKEQSKNIQELHNQQKTHNFELGDLQPIPLKTYFTNRLEDKPLPEQIGKFFGPAVQKLMKRGK
ncbi:DNA polymerase III subunit gamma/tau [Mycoplasmopsis sturni]|uniref:DNA polymerase III subunit gamma/tau n=1 Tax=Mycoplasmopsis sturni TaxID=39047 RepID=UPI00068F8674|nr:DNA polymerase III subunit gamma/tau [Mycoplasmopsis sturni]